MVFLTFARNFGDKYGKKLIDATKIVSKRVVQMLMSWK